MGQPGVRVWPGRLRDMSKKGVVKQPMCEETLCRVMTNEPLTAMLQPSIHFQYYTTACQVVW